MKTPDPLVIGQLGCGYWGPNLARNFASLPDCELRYVADPSRERRAFVHDTFPKISAVDSPKVVLDDPEVAAVVVATPAASHFELARQALEAGKHVLVEKPLATTVAEVDELGRCAAARGRVLMAGHTFVYNAAVRYVKKLIDSGELGDVRYVYSQRLNLGRIRSDIDALWNFAPHDISIIQYWLNDQEPTAVLRQGMDFIQPGVDDVVFLNLAYPNKIIANIHVSWLDPQKVRKMTVVGSKKMVVYDDVADDKIAIYDKGIDRKAVLGENMDFDRPLRADFSYRSGDILLPHVKFVEPLRLEAEHFVHCIRTGQAPMTGFAHARAVVGILERAEAVRGTRR
jgi:predicted dehydrogenase